MGFSVRKFNHAGVEEFRIFLNTLRSFPSTPVPQDLLYAENYTQMLDWGIEVDQVVFSSRLEAAQYFADLFKEKDGREIAPDVGLWSWLSLFYFDQVCPLIAGNKRFPGRDYRHIPEPGYRSGHRHLLGGAFLVHQVYKLGDQLSRLLLSTRLHREGHFHHELASRVNLITNKGVIEAVDMLYFSEKNKRAKRGCQSKVIPGNLYRLIDVLQQFDLTYDLHSMDGKQIISLLPKKEFAYWLKK